MKGSQCYSLKQGLKGGNAGVSHNGPVARSVGRGLGRILVEGCVLEIRWWLIVT